MAFDALVWTVTVLVFVALRYIDVASGIPWADAFLTAALAVALQLAIGRGLWIYQGRYRIGSKDEAVAVGATVVYTSLALLVLSLVFPGGRLIAVSVPIGAGALAVLGTIGGRVVWRTVHESTMRPLDSAPVLVFGAGSAGIQLVVNMLTDPGSPYLPVGLLDDDAAKRHMRVQGVRVLGNRTALAQAALDTGAAGLVIAVPSGDAMLFRDLSDAAGAIGLHVKVLPGLRQILDGDVGFRDLRDIEITDVLGRAKVDTNVEAIAGYLTGRRVLVTGAGGSIGSELCRQITRFDPAELYMLDRDESALHALQLSLTGAAMLDTDDVILCDIRDAEALFRVFESRRPEVVFHAAALKHLPMLEQYPEEAWKTNVLGTRNVLEAAQRVDVAVCVNISTDKAANPVSILGYSKRLAERLTAGMAHATGRHYVSVRFGNVLGSRGSVLTTFAEQAASRGPVTVTDPEVTRFFMVIPEACELVIQAVAVGHPAEALVLEMGEPVRIVEVAQQIIQMSGQSGVEIVFTGLRPGEKLHEELFGDDEVVRPTAHEMVRAVTVPPLGVDEVPGHADWSAVLGGAR